MINKSSIEKDIHNMIQITNNISAIFLLICLLTNQSNAQMLDKGIQYYDSGALDKAKVTLKRIQKDQQDFHRASFYLGRIAFDKEDYDAAEEYFEEAIDANDRVSDYHLWLGNTYGVVARDANVFKQGFLAPKIKNSYEKAVELDDRNIDALSGLVQYYTRAPGFMGGSWEKGLQMAEKIFLVDPAKGHSARATVYLSQEKYTLAENEYIKAAKLSDDKILNLGYFYRKREQYNKAFDTYERLMNSDDLRVIALYQIGKTSALSGEKSVLGIESLQEYLKAEPEENQQNHAFALMRLGMIYEKIGDKKIAKSYYSQSLVKNPKQEEAKKGVNRLQ